TEPLRARACTVVERGGKPSNLSDAIRTFLGKGRIGSRVTQAEVLAEWPAIVGEQIAAVTEARSVTSDGTLTVHARTNAWMTELSLREPEILAAITEKMPMISVRRI